MADDLTERLAAAVRAARADQDLTVAALAERSGVSRAMIAKVERGDAQPTAALLSKLSGALGLTLSALIARAEQPHQQRLARRADQPVWTDPDSGYVRRAVSPTTTTSPLELVEVELPAGANIPIAADSYTFIHQQIWILDGTLTFHEGATVHRLGPGDCLSLGPPVDHTFENRTKRVCRYLVVVVRR